MSRAVRRRLLRVLTISALSGVSRAHGQLDAEPERLDTSGVEFPAETVLDGVRLVRNGVGVRYRFVVRVYVAALYTAETVRSATAALDLRRSRMLRVVMLRDIEGAELGRLLMQGMRNNASLDELGRSLPGVLRLGELFAEKKRLSKGESFAIEWLPSRGTRITINDRSTGLLFPEPALFTALLKIWIGSSPADESLKRALLAGPPVP